MITGMISPGESLVRALNCLQNSMMFTPCWPSAGPTGGAGFACAPGTCSLSYPVTFLAIFLLPYDLPENPGPGAGKTCRYCFNQRRVLPACGPEIRAAPRQTDSTCSTSSSTEVGRPKMETMTFSLLFS